jgi:hypothetical protein
VTIDDATGWIYSAFFVDQEGTMSSFVGLLETISAHGLFGSFYTDGGSHYFHTPVAGGAVDKKQLTQVGRALKQLGIRHIPSYTPEGRGRMERVFRTLQQRLPPLLRRASVLTKERANIWLRETYVPEHNARFGKEAAEPAVRSSAEPGWPWRRCCATSKIARSAATTACPGPADRCKFRNNGIGVITLRPWCACTNIPMGGWQSLTVRAALSVSMPKEFRSMSQPLPREPVRPAVLNLARRATALKDATRRLRRWPRGSARPSLTAAVRLALGCSGRDEKTAFQPNQKTGLAAEAMRTTHALQKADIFTRHRQLGRPTCNGTWKRQSVYRRGCHGRR